MLDLGPRKVRFHYSMNQMPSKRNTHIFRHLQKHSHHTIQVCMEAIINIRWLCKWLSSKPKARTLYCAINMCTTAQEKNTSLVARQLDNYQQCQTYLVVRTLFLVKIRYSRGRKQCASIYLICHYFLLPLFIILPYTYYYTPN